MYLRIEDFVTFNRILNTKKFFIKYFKFFKYCKFLLTKMLPQEFETIEAEEVQASEQDVQPYFEHRLWSEYCCTTLPENVYINVIGKKLVCEDCYMMKLTCFDSEVTLLVEIDYIVIKDLYYTLKLSSLD